jgi:hypothetical protein
MILYRKTFWLAGIGNSGQMWTSRFALPVTTLYDLLLFKAFKLIQ